MLSYWGWAITPHRRRCHLQLSNRPPQSPYQGPRVTSFGVTNIRCKFYYILSWLGTRIFPFSSPRRLLDGEIVPFATIGAFAGPRLQFLRHIRMVSLWGSSRGCRRPGAYRRGGHGKTIHSAWRGCLSRSTPKVGKRNGGIAGMSAAVEIRPKSTIKALAKLRLDHLPHSILLICRL